MAQSLLEKENDGSALQSEAEKALKQAAETAVLAAIDLVKARIGQETEKASQKGAKEALGIATDLIKQMITLSMGAIVFSATMLKATSGGSSGKDQTFLFLSWLLWGISLIIGLIAMGRVVTLTNGESYNPMEPGLTWLGILQQLFLVLGVASFAWYVVFFNG